MLELTIPYQESFDESTFIFSEVFAGQILRLEHSLISISKWESIYKKPFLSLGRPQTDEELKNYIVRCMSLSTLNTELIEFITPQNLNDVVRYIDDPMSATTFISFKKNEGKREVITSELIYYWMVRYQIPMECEKWHLNRLLTLVKICNNKDPNSPSKKMSQADIIENRRALNEARRQGMQ